MFKKVIGDLIRKYAGYGSAGAGSFTWLLSQFQAWGPFGSGAATPWKYDMYAWQGYMSNPIVNRCISLICNTVAGIPWVLYHKSADGRDVQIEQAPILDLLKNPNPRMSEKDFFFNYVMYLQLSGNTYVHRVGPTGTRPPRELYFLRPDRIIILNADNDVGGFDDGVINDGYNPYEPIYEYMIGRSRQRIDPKVLYHGKLFNPLCDFYGLSSIQAAATSIDQSNASLEWNVNLLRNYASPPGILKTADNLGDEQISRLKEQMREKKQGPVAGTNPWVLDGGLEWQPMAHTPAEMLWLEGQKMATKNICLALGVDPSLVGDSDHRSFNTFRDAQKSFYTETVIPICDKIRDDFLNRWLLPLFPNTENMYFNYNLDEVEALNEDRAIVWDRIIVGLEAGLITMNEAREAVGYTELDAALQQEEPDLDNEDEVGAEEEIEDEMEKD